MSQPVLTGQDVDLNRYLLVVRQWLWLLVLSAVVAGGISFIISVSMPKTYTAALTLVVGDDTANLHPSVEDVTVSQRLAGVYAGMVTREPILTATVNSLHLPTAWWELQRRVLVVRTDGSQIIEIRATDSDPQRTKATVDELAHQLTLQSPTAENAEALERRREFVRQQLERIQGNIQDAESRLAAKQAALSTETSARGVLDLQDEIKALELNLTNWRGSYASMLATNIARSPNTLTVIQPSMVPTQPVGPNLPANVLTGTLLGLLAGIGTVLIIESARGARVKAPDDVSRVFSLPLLGTIGRLAPSGPETERLIMAHAPQTIVAEDFRHLRTNLQFAWATAEPPLMLLITSAGAEEGKSVVSANLAIAFARGGKRTILVDADITHPSVHVLFGVPNHGGLTALFWSDQVRVSSRGADMASTGDPATVLRRRLEALLVPGVVPGLRLLTAGAGPDDDKVDTVASDDAEHLLRSLRDVADVIILDGPPVLAAAETAALAALSVGVVLVVEAGETRVDAARFALETLRRARARILGVVLNKTRNSSTAYYHSYRRRGIQRNTGGSTAFTSRS